MSVAVTLNTLIDHAFLDARSDNDRTAMAELIEDYFCDDDSGNVHSSNEKQTPFMPYYIILQKWKI